MLYFVVSEQLHWIEGEGYVVVKAAAADGEEDPATGGGDRGDRAAPPRGCGVGGSPPGVEPPPEGERCHFPIRAQPSMRFGLQLKNIQACVLALDF